MKRLTILGIIACVGLVFGATAVIADPAGPADGLNVKVVNPLPLPVEGDVNATVTGSVEVTNTPDVNVVNDDDNPVSVKVSPGDEPLRVITGFSYVGSTSNLYTGNLGGLVGAANKCRSEFGPEARMCTTKDIIMNPPPQDQFVGGWIQPVPVAIYTTSGINRGLDSSGYVYPFGPNGECVYYHNCITCSQWKESEASSGIRQGLVMQLGEFGVDDCIEAHGVVCCAP